MSQSVVATMIAEQIAGNGIKPRIESGFSAVSLASLINAQEHFLCQVLGFLAVSRPIHQHT
jgi:hypothetical protein